MPREREIVVVESSQAIPALASFFVPGLGQLIQGRFFAWIVWWIVLTLCAASILIGIGVVLLPLGWIFNIVDAAKYRPRA